MIHKPYFFRVFQGSSIVHDEDIEVDQNKLTKIQNLFSMNHSRHRFSHRKQFSSTVTPNHTSSFIDEYPNARKVQIRLVFIHIGKN